MEFIKEDIHFEDITSKIIPPKKIRAGILLKEAGVVAGINEVTLLFSLFNVKVLSSVKDGFVVPNSKRIMLIQGNAQDILLLERTALNILSKMSGVATLTKEYVSRAKKVNPKITVAATRKTTPGFRYFEKRAVEIGGGDSHIMGLSDMLMIKDNHLKILKGVKNALDTAKDKKAFAHKLEIEVSNKKDALTAAKFKPDIIMLDNMNPKKIKQTLLQLSGQNLRKNIIIEASGGVNLDNIAEYARSGVDVISTGQLTSNYKALNISLEVI